MDINKWGLGQGGFVFLSHSHQDISKVRQIRNYLEEQGFEPLCFYLKCLEEDAEIFNLIEREIKSREWFVFLQSNNSDKSEWVQKELECAERMRKAIIKIDINNEISAKKVSDLVACSMRVFLNYSHKDVHIAKTIFDYLHSKDLKVFFDENDLKVDSSFSQKIQDNLIEAANNGCVISLITEQSINSQYFMKELLIALENQANILPIVIGDFEMPSKLLFCIGGIQWLRFPSGKDIDLDKIYSITKQILLSKLTTI